MPDRVCIDASIALMLLLPDSLRYKAKALWDSWDADKIEIIAPPLFFVEVTSVLRENVYFGRILPEEGERALSSYQDLCVKTLELHDLQSQSWSMAKRFNRPKAYDAQYLAVASILECELWPGDIRLVNAVHQPWVKWVGDYE